MQFYFIILIILLKKQEDYYYFLFFFLIKIKITLIILRLILRIIWIFFIFCKKYMDFFLLLLNFLLFF